MKYTEYINPNKSGLGFTLSNWIYDPSDKFEIVFKMNSNPNTKGNWPQLMGTANSSSAKLLLQFNLWSGRTVLNIAYNGEWSGDGNVSYSSPYDYDSFYKLTADAGTFWMYKGEAKDGISTPVFTKTYDDGAGSGGESMKLFAALATSGYLDMNLYGIKAWNRQGELIHYYVPITDGLLDRTDGTSYLAETEGHINGPAVLDGKFLIGDGAGRLYTIADGELSELEGTVPSKSMFLSEGVDEIPDGAFLLELSDPKVYYWQDSDDEPPAIRISASETPEPQVVVTENIHLSHSTIVGVENVTIEADDSTLFAVSFDDGIIWWNCVDGRWAMLSETLSGQTGESVGAISTDAWAQKVKAGGTMKFRFVISGSGYVESITVHYLN